MFEEMNMIVLSGKEYPMKCDNGRVKKREFFHASFCLWL